MKQPTLINCWHGTSPTWRNGDYEIQPCKKFRDNLFERANVEGFNQHEIEQAEGYVVTKNTKNWKTATNTVLFHSESLKDCINWCLKADDIIS